MKEKLRNIIEDNTSKKGKIFDVWVLGDIYGIIKQLEGCD